MTIPAGARSVAIPVTVKADNFGEPTESFSLILSPVANVELGRSDTVGVATLLDDNGLPALYIDSVAPVVEADSTITFHLRLQFPRSDTIHVKIRTAAGTATPGEDYVDSSVTIAIPPTKTSYDLNIRILDDRFNEPDTESFTVKLVEADSANIQDSTGLASLLDDDLPPTVSVLDGSVVEPAAWGAVDSLRMKVVLSAISHVPASVEWRTQDGSAKGNLDYFPSQGTLLFSSGDSVLLVSIPVVGDSLDEPDETLDVRLSSPLDASLADSIGVGTITDNDTAPGIHVYGTRTTEPATGTTPATLRIRLDRPSGKAISFQWATRDGSAKAGSDYDAASGGITLPIGAVDTLVRVSVRADSVAGEGDETYQVKLSSLVDALPSDTLATGTIVDLQGLPGVSIFSLAPIEEKDTTIHFVVRLNYYPAQPVRVWLHTQAGSATPGLRYVDTAGSILFPAMSRVDSFGVRILNDKISERIPETFRMILDSAKTANILDPVGNATLLDDGDEPPVVIGNADTVSEGGVARFPVRLTSPTKDSVWVYWRTQDSTARATTKDYTAASGTLLFVPGQRLLNIEIPVLVDSVWEPMETFKVVLDSVRQGLLSARDREGIAWVRDGGEPPRIGFGKADTSVVEDKAGDVPVRIVLDRPASIDLSVVVSVSGASTAQQGVDYSLRDLIQDTVRIPAGSTSARFVVRVVPDSIDEFDETVDLDLRPLSPAGSGALLTHRLTILDDDEPPSLVFRMDTMTVVEDVGQVRVIARLSRVSAKPVSASYHVQGTATPGTDHDIVAGQLIGFSFKPGMDTASIVFKVVDDRITEPTETVDLMLDSARNASLVVGQTRQIV
ncbi:MAG TPA: Calx-beta domain-containing protein, partial [Fibrobacteria bacterium]|nr:Calx-beta domain-containing protein [Fibrobacteria bacterium]